MTRTLLWLGVAAPVLYYAVLLAGPLIFPGYDHVTQYASELGGPKAPNPMIFNLTIMAAGVAAVLGGLGFFRGLTRIGGGRIASALAGLSIALWGAGMVMGGMFPMPDERHGGFGVGLAVQVAPLFAAWALWKVPGAGKARWALVALAVVMAVFFAIMMGIGGLVSRANVGLWQRAYSLAMIPWIGLLALWLLKRPELAAPSRAAAAA